VTGLYEKIFPNRFSISQFDLERRPIEFFGMKLYLEGRLPMVDLGMLESFLVKNLRAIAEAAEECDIRDVPKTKRRLLVDLSEQRWTVLYETRGLMPEAYAISNEDRTEP